MEDNNSGNIRNRLTIKQVTLEHIDQFDELLRYVFQVTNEDLALGGYDENEELTKAKRPVLKEADVVGWFNKEDELVSQVAVYPCEVNIHGTIYKMGGMTGVGTYPEYSGHGLVSELIKMALRGMKDRGQTISYLFPYSIPFYRKKGWELMSDHMTYVIKDTQLPMNKDVPGHVERVEVDHEDVINIYDEFARLNHGALIRHDLDWEEYWRWENEEERIAGVYYDAEDNPTGYVFYWIQEDILHIKETVYLNQEARKGLWNFISAHHSMIDEVHGNVYKNEPISFLIEDGDIKQTIVPYYMARIVDVEAFLKEYPFDTEDLEVVEPFHLSITDPMAEWNNGIFGIEFDEEGNTIITKNLVGKRVEMDIQTLVTMLMGYRRPTYLWKIERINGELDTIRDLEWIIPDEEPYFSDYF
ncbi:MAG: GNAT family N-acetyltransferase [Tissierellia bacterium]|nr:GNAT family N-acetyltransferase [Tissierellia bacterium]